MNMRQAFWMGTGVLAAATVAHFTLRPADIHSAIVTSLSRGTICYANVMWMYGSGVRPASVIIDVTAGNGAGGSITTDGETISGRIPLSHDFHGDYTITFTATYRILGMIRTAVWTFTGTV